MLNFFALWRENGVNCWAGPFWTNTAAREAVPAAAEGSVITTAIAMTPGEKREALRLVGMEAEL